MLIHLVGVLASLERVRTHWRLRMRMRDIVVVAEQEAMSFLEELRRPSVEEAKATELLAACHTAMDRLVEVAIQYVLVRWGMVTQPVVDQAFRV